MKTGIEVIAEERRRQLEDEGYSLEHDDRHRRGEMARAASCYAMPVGYRDYTGQSGTPLAERQPFDWPWQPEDWSPTPVQRLRELAKAGALIAAEIDRLQRQVQY